MKPFRVPSRRNRVPLWRSEAGRTGEVMVQTPEEKRAKRAASSLRARTAYRPPLRPATRPRQPSFFRAAPQSLGTASQKGKAPAASTPANQQWDSQMHCSGALLGYWFVVAGDAAQFRGAHRQLSTTCQTAAPLCAPLACAIHDVSSELQSVRVSVLCSMAARVSTHSSMV